MNNRAIEKYSKVLRMSHSKIQDEFIESFKNDTFWERLKIAWRIIKGNKIKKEKK